MIKRLQKVLAFAFAGGLALTATEAGAQSLYEPFNYAVGSNLGGQSAWVNVNSGDEVVVVDGSLSYNNLKTAEGNSVSFGGGGIDPQYTLSQQTTTGTVYYSLLFKVTDLGTLDNNGGYFTGIAATSTSFGSTLWLRKSGEGFNIGFNKRTSTSEISWIDTVFPINETVLVVGSYQLIAEAANDVAKIWVNPAIGTTEPAANLQATAGTDLEYIERFFLRQDSGNETPASMIVDEVRVGTTWESVTPSSTSTGIADATRGMFSIYPNPMQNQNVRLSLPGHIGAQKVSLTVWSVEGKELFKATGSQAQVQESLNSKMSSLSKGMFFVNVTAGKEVYQTKLLKN